MILNCNVYGAHHQIVVPEFIEKARYVSDEILSHKEGHFPIIPSDFSPEKQRHESKTSFRVDVILSLGHFNHVADIQPPNGGVEAEVILMEQLLSLCLSLWSDMTKRRLPSHRIVIK